MDSLTFTPIGGMLNRIDYGWGAPLTLIRADTAALTILPEERRKLFERFTTDRFLRLQVVEEK
jgi:hypothetical protein